MTLSPAIQSRINQLDAYFEMATGQDLPDEMQKHLSKLAAVLVCGFVERSVEIIVLDRLVSRAHPKVLNFVKSHFKRGTNYDCEAIHQLLARFDPGWQTNFKIFMNDNDQIVASLTSVYGIRNSVAHGGDMNRSISGIKTIFEDCKTLVAQIQNCRAHPHVH